MAKHHRQKEQPPENGQQEPEVPAEPITAKTDIKALFNREINGNSPIKSVAFKRTLTRPLIAMIHEKQLLFTCNSEVYTMQLPSKGRGAAPSTAIVVDGENVETAEECTLILNAVMVSSFQRAGYQVVSRNVKLNDKQEEEVTYDKTDGQSIIGHSFAFRLDTLNEDKGYRVVETVEVEIEK